MQEPRPLYIYLAYAGTLPFLLGVILLAFGIRIIPYIGGVVRFVQLYGLVIASFISGTHWGQYLSSSSKVPINLFIISNLITICVWLSFIFLSPLVFLEILTLIFLILLLLDRQLYHQHFITRNYFQTRIIATVIVMLTLIIIGGLS
ncbi:MAG: DUF3429 domain-containing protein [Burkholderiales bacterium]